MYIRWKTKARVGNLVMDEESPYYLKKKPSTLYIAYLVESKRVNGKPRQKTTYLGSIQDYYIEQPGHRKYFWQSAQKHIAPLNLNAEQISMIRTKLQERVPIPTKDQLENAAREHAQAMTKISGEIKNLKANM